LQDTQQVAAGSWLAVDVERRRSSGRFFEFPVWRQPDLRGAEADDAVDAAVRAAVSRHAVADVPLGTFLSGGIDSPLVASFLCDVAARPNAFTMSTGGDELDEAADAALYARQIGVEHVVATLTPERAVAMLDDVVDACSEPLADYSIFPTLFIAELARTRVKVALSGDGGDELFWGYAGRFGTILEKLGQPQSAESGEGWNWSRVLAAGAGGDSRWPSGVGDLQRARHTHASEGWLARVFPELPPWPADFRIFAYDGLEPEPTAQWLRWNEFEGHLPKILQKVDRGSMFHGLEVRAPLLDREVIEVASRIDWRSCLDPSRRVGKLPLRRALAKRVSHMTVAKRGFTVPMDAWLRGPLRPIFEDVVLRRRSIAGLAVDGAALRQRFERHLDGRSDDAAGLWGLLSLSLWEERHAQGSPV
jgi:asparagine synthase (glutamine-hydrolysing)